MVAGMAATPHLDKLLTLAQLLCLATCVAAKGSTGSRKWWILSVLCISVLLVAIDNTIVNVALPTLTGGSTRQRLTCRTLFFVVCGELAAGAHSPVRSEIRTLVPPGHDPPP
jgi:hypothetical protein